MLDARFIIDVCGMTNGSPRGQPHSLQVTDETAMMQRDALVSMKIAYGPVRCTEMCRDAHHDADATQGVARARRLVLYGDLSAAAAVALLLWPHARICRRPVAASAMFLGGAVLPKERVAKRQGGEVFVLTTRDEAI